MLRVQGAQEWTFTSILHCADPFSGAPLQGHADSSECSIQPRGGVRPHSNLLTYIRERVRGEYAAFSGRILQPPGGFAPAYPLSPRTVSCSPNMPQHPTRCDVCAENGLLTFANRPQYVQHMRSRHPKLYRCPVDGCSHGTWLKQGLKAVSVHHALRQACFDICPGYCSTSGEDTVLDFSFIVRSLGVLHLPLRKGPLRPIRVVSL